MKLKVKVEKYKFQINIGQGLNDFAWLALAAAKLYGELKYPKGNYRPCLLDCNGFVPHPRFYKYFLRKTFCCYCDLKNK